MTMPKIVFVSDGTPDGSKLYLNGQEAVCNSCYINFSAPKKDGEYEYRGHVSVEIQTSAIDESGSNLNIIYRMTPPDPAVKANLTFKKEIKHGKSRK